jgi:5'-nucleotidase
MHFLLTNDDGIDAPGLVALENAVARLAGAASSTYTTVAPHEHQSGCGHLTTTSRPLRVARFDDRRCSVDGSPADCVRLGLLHLAEAAEWVLSGINDGGNLGVDVYMSGTVAAAREGALFGRRAVAISHYRSRGQPIDWTWASAQAQRVLALLLTMPPAAGAFWNVNLPAPIDAEHAPEIVFCPLELSPLHVCYEQVDDGYHFRGAYQDRKRSAGTDVETCFAGRISVTQVPLG